MAYNTYNSWQPNTGSQSYGVFTNPPSNVSNDNLRRVFGLGSRIAELSPAETPWFSILTRFLKIRLLILFLKQWK